MSNAQITSERTWPLYAVFTSHVDQTDLTCFTLSHAGEHFVINRLEGGIIKVSKNEAGYEESYDM